MGGAAASGGDAHGVTAAANRPSPRGGRGANVRRAPAASTIGSTTMAGLPVGNLIVGIRGYLVEKNAINECYIEREREREQLSCQKRDIRHFSSNFLFRLCGSPTSPLTASPLRAPGRHFWFPSHENVSTSHLPTGGAHARHPPLDSTRRRQGRHSPSCVPTGKTNCAGKSGFANHIVKIGAQYTRLAASKQTLFQIFSGNIFPMFFQDIFPRRGRKRGKSA